MPSSESAENLWVERSRLNGMILGAVSYGIYFWLAVEFALTMRKRAKQGKPVKNATILQAYNIITFVLATIGFATNVKYTQMIWIDLRDVQGGPVSLIFLEMDYWVNRAALSCYYVMEWLMQALLLYRCFFVWDYERYIVIPLSFIFLAMIATSIMVLVNSSRAVFYNIDFQTAYLSLSVGLTLLYSILIIGRVLYMRKMVIKTLGEEYARIHISMVALIVESVAPYSALGIIFVVAFALHSNVVNLVFLAISHVQGIAQLLILLRVARGESFAEDTFCNDRPSSMVFNENRNRHGANEVYMHDTPQTVPTTTSSEDDSNVAQHTKKYHSEWEMSFKNRIAMLTTKSMP